MDFVFDPTAYRGVIKSLPIIDEATHELRAIEIERALSGHGVAWVLERLSLSRGLPEVMGTENEKEFCCQTMVARAYARGVQLSLIEAGKPNQGCLRRSVHRSATRRVPQRA